MSVLEAAEAELLAGTPVSSAEAALRRAAFERVSRAVISMIVHSDASHLAQGVGERSDLLALMSLVTDRLGEDLASASGEESYAAALLRGVTAKQTLLEQAGGSLDGTEVAALLDISRQAVDKRRQKRQLLGVSLPAGHVRYPAAQFTEQGVVPGLPQVLEAFAVESPWMQLDALLAPQERLDGQTAFEALRSGADRELVGRLMAQSGDQGR